MPTKTLDWTNTLWVHHRCEELYSLHPKCARTHSFILSLLLDKCFPYNMLHFHKFTPRAFPFVNQNASFFLYTHLSLYVFEPLNHVYNLDPIDLEGSNRSPFPCQKAHMKMSLGITQQNCSLSSLNLTPSKIHPSYQTFPFELEKQPYNSVRKLINYLHLCINILVDLLIFVPCMELHLWHRLVVCGTVAAAWAGLIEQWARCAKKLCFGHSCEMDSSSSRWYQETKFQKQWAKDGWVRWVLDDVEGRDGWEDQYKYFS